MASSEPAVRCPLAPPAGASAASNLRHRLTHLLIPPVRAYVRHGPGGSHKRAVWERVVEPYFAWHSRSFTARTRFGAQMTGTTDDILQQYVYYFGLWEPQITQWIARALRPGDVFVDVGANVGYHALLASRIVGDDGAVLAFEPSPRLFGLLRRNLDQNRAANTRALQIALADRDARIPLFEGPDSNTGLTATTAAPGLEPAGEVDAKPLRAVLDPEEFARVRLVKIDVEGGEAAVVEGMRSLLASARDDLEVLVEVHPEGLAQAGREAADVMDVFRAEGFDVYRIENDYSAAALLAGVRDVEPDPVEGVPESECNLLFTRNPPASRETA